jgi:hypothetical protein
MMDLGGKLFDGKQVWAQTDGSEVWCVWPETAVEVEGSRRALTPEEFEAHFGPAALTRSKAAALAMIDQVTGERIAAGAPLPEPWPGVRLSASLNAQFNWLNRYERRATLTFPIPYPSADNSSIIQVKSVEEVELIYLTGDAWVQGHLRASTEAKAAILACAAIEEVEAVATAFKAEK